MPKVVTLNAGTSTVSVAPTIIDNDGVMSSDVTVRVLNTDGEPMQGLAAARVVIASTGTGNTITQPTGVTDINGDITGSIVSTNAASKTLSATVLGAAVTDTATLTVQGTNSFTPNLPGGVGLTLVSDSLLDDISDTFNADNLRGEYDYSLATDLTAPYSTTVFQTDYPGNNYGNGATGAQLYNRRTDTWFRIYFSLTVWVSEDYSVHSNQEKWWYPVIKTSGVTTGACEIAWRPNSPETPDGTTWSIHFDPQYSGSSPSYPVNAVPLEKGVWQTVECYMVMNTPGTSNASLRIWVDGVESFNLTGIRVSNEGVQSYIDGIRFTGTRGGGASSSPTPPGGQQRRYSRLAFYAAGS
jgi:hypothetical protein